MAQYTTPRVILSRGAITPVCLEMFRISCLFRCCRQLFSSKQILTQQNWSVYLTLHHLAKELYKFGFKMPEQGTKRLWLLNIHPSITAYQVHLQINSDMVYHQPLVILPLFYHPFIILYPSIYHISFYYIIITFNKYVFQ